MIAFVRQLLPTLSSDHIILAIYGAAKDVGVPKEEVAGVLHTLLSFKKRNDIWPEGFMS